MRCVLLVLAASAGVTLLSHGAALNVPLQGDDLELFAALEARGAKDLADRFRFSAWRDPETGSYAPYRPVRDFTYTLCALAFGAKPQPFHAASLLLHLANAMLVYGLACAFYRSRRVAFWAAMLFAACAAHVEAVTYTKNLAETQALFFGLLSLWLAARFAATGRGRLWHGAGAAVAYALAVLTKESAWPIPLLFGVWVAMKPRRGRLSRPVGLLALLLLLAAGYGYLLVSLQRAGAPVRFTAQVRTLSVPARIEFASQTTLGYLRDIFAPLWQNYWPQPPLPEGAGVHTAAAALVAGLLVWVTTRNRVLARTVFGVWWMCLALGPVSNLVAGSTGRPVALQRAYTPSVGWALFMACVVAGWPAAGLGKRLLSPQAMRWRALAGSLLVAAGIALSAHHTAKWQTPLSLWRHTVKTSPDSFKPQFNLALTYGNADRLAQAAAHYRAALAIRPDAPDALYNLANTLHRAGRSGEAEAHYRRTLALDSDRHQAYNGLGAALASQGKMAEAEAAFERAFDIAPSSRLAALSLIRIHEMAGRHGEIVRVASEALKHHPADIALQEKLSHALEAARRDAERHRRDPTD